MAKER